MEGVHQGREKDGSEPGWNGMELVWNGMVVGNGLQQAWNGKG